MSANSQFEVWMSHNGNLFVVSWDAEVKEWIFEVSLDSFPMPTSRRLIENHPNGFENLGPL